LIWGYLIGHKKLNFNQNSLENVGFQGCCRFILRGLTTKGNGLQTVTLAFKVYESLASQTFGRRDFALILKLKSLRFDALNEVALMVTCVQFQIVVCFRPFLIHTINIENGIRR
jgi:hypothetical protein